MIIDTVQDLIDALADLPESTRGAQLRITDGVHCDTPVLGVSYDQGIVAVSIEAPDCPGAHDDYDFITDEDRFPRM